MPRVKRGVTTKQNHKKILKLAKGYKGRRSKSYCIAKQAVMHAKQYSYRDRKNKKRVFRSLWISRINAAVKQYGLKYNNFIHLLKLKSIELNRKILSNLAILDKKSFYSIIKKIT